MKTRRAVSLLLALLTLISILPMSAVHGQAVTNVALTIWSDDYTHDWIVSRVEDFNAQSSKWNISVTLEALSVADAGMYASSDPAAAADLYIFPNDQLGTLVEAGALLPITGSALTQVCEDNAQTMLDSVSYSDGNVYGIPYTSNTWFMYYNKSIFSESDVKSLETMLEKGKVSFGLMNSWYLASFYFANGCTMFGEIGLDSMAGIDFYNDNGVGVTKYLADLVQHPNFVVEDNWEGRIHLEEGEVGAYFSGTWDSYSVQTSLGDNYAAAQLPTIQINGETKQLKAFAGSKAYGVNPYGKNTEAAMALAAFLGNRQSQIERYELFTDVPACPALSSKAEDNPAVQAQINTIANASVIQPWIPEMSFYWDPAGSLGSSIACGEVNEDNADEITKQYVLLMNDGLLITEHPENVEVESGARATASVKAEGEGLKYQWYYKSAGSTKFSKSSVTSAAYSINMSENANGRQIYCIVSDIYGTMRRSKTVTLSMPATELEITQQPSSVYVANGATAKVTVKAAGDGLTYQWYFKNAGASKYSKSSVTSATYATKMSSTSKDRYVYCIVTDKYGNSVKSKTVVLRMTASITTQPKTTYTKSGSTAKVTVKAAGDGLTYQWYYKNAGATKFSKSSVTSATYGTTMNDKSKDRAVYCVVTDKYGNTVKSNTVYLRMAATVTTQPKTTYTKSGSTAKVTVKAVGDGLTYQWYIKSAGATKFTKSSVTSATYATKMSSTSKDRQVYCVVTDKYGNTVKTNTVYLRMAATITSQPSSVSVEEGEKATVTVKAVGDGLTYQWYFADKGSDSFKLTTTYTGTTYSVTMNDARDGRRVYCVITDKYGKSVTTNTVTISMK